MVNGFTRRKAVGDGVANPRPQKKKKVGITKTPNQKTADTVRANTKELHAANWRDSSSSVDQSEHRGENDGYLGTPSDSDSDKEEFEDEEHVQSGTGKKKGNANETSIYDPTCLNSSFLQMKAVSFAEAEAT